MAMLPFCGYNMGDYFEHWLRMQYRLNQPPKVFMVNWFRKDQSGKFLWPGFGENSRVLKWVFERCDGDADVQESFVGLHPTAGGLDLEGLEISREDLDLLLKVDAGDWRREVTLLHDHYFQFGNRLPRALADQLAALESQLKAITV